MERKATKRKYRHKVRCLECKKEVDSDFFKAHVSKQHPGKDKSYETSNHLKRVYRFRKLLAQPNSLVFAIVMI